MNPNELLLWLSATGDGTWSRCRAALDELAVAETPANPTENTDENSPAASRLSQHVRIRLNFERLGHAEFFRHDFPTGWRVVPPTLVSMPGGTGVRGVLCGARTNQLLTDLHELAGDAKVFITPQEECPDRIVLKHSSLQELAEVASKGRLIFQKAGIDRLLTVIPPVDSHQLRAPAELPFGQDWQVNRFSARSLTWIESSIDEARGRIFGLFRIHIRYRPEYFLRFQGNAYKLPVQVGKYIVLKRARRRVLDYDHERGILSMPVSCRPPLLLDRALTLCSGLIPEFVQGRLEYPSVGPRHSRAAKRLLRQ